MVKAFLAVCLLALLATGECAATRKLAGLTRTPEGTVKTEGTVETEGEAKGVTGSTGTITDKGQESTSFGASQAGEDGNVKTKTKSFVKTDDGFTRTLVITHARDGGSALGYADADLGDGYASTDTFAKTDGDAKVITLAKAKELPGKKSKP